MALGTSSGRPTRDRHVSAFAVDVGGHWILVDCGDGTQHQVLVSPLKLARLDTVLITHLHGDHALGLPALLATMGLEGRSERLRLVGPVGLRGWLAATAATPLLWVEFPLEIIELDDATFEDGSPRRVGDVQGHTIDTLPLRHRVPCFGFRITEAPRPGHVMVDRAASLGLVPGPDLGRLQRGESVTVGGVTVSPEQVLAAPRRPRAVAVFGDTMPCEHGVTLARDADLLIHEATYSEQHADLAEMWTHSTAMQAATVARDAGAARLLITHFSARHGDPAPLVEEARTVFAATDAAVELAWVAASPVVQG